MRTTSTRTFYLDTWLSTDFAGSPPATSIVGTLGVMGPADSARTVPPALRYSPASRALLEKRRRAGQVVRVRPGVYLPAPTGEGHARRREAEVLISVRGVVERLATSYWLSHETAALLWGCWTWHLGRSVHVTQLANPSVRRDSDRKSTRLNSSHWE